MTQLNQVSLANLMIEVLSFNATSEKLMTVNDFIISLYLPACMIIRSSRKEKLHFNNYWKFKDLTLKSLIYFHVFSFEYFFLKTEYNVNALVFGLIVLELEFQFSNALDMNKLAYLLFSATFRISPRITWSKTTIWWD